jgi:hypothetical protein
VEFQRQLNKKETIYMSHIRYLIFLVVLIPSGFYYAQSPIEKDTLKIIQLSGVVISEETLEELPYVTVFDKTLRKGVISDYYGYFSMVTFPGDTIVFSSPGHKKSSYIVPDTLKQNRYSLIHMIPSDTLQLSEVTIYPWPTKEEFANAFVNMRPYDDALRRAQQELSGESLAFAAARIQTDPSLAYGNIMNQRYSQLYSSNQVPVNNLLNPYAWSKFLKDWKDGKLNRQ